MGADRVGGHGLCRVGAKQGQEPRRIPPEVVVVFISRLAGVLRMAQVSLSTPWGLRQRSQMPAKANTGRSSR